MRRTCMWLIVIGGLLSVSAADAAAQSGTYSGLATGFLGTIGGGDLRRTSVTFGASASVNEADSGWGADMDLAYADDDAGSTAADVTTFMLNANWTKPIGLVRPYISGGVGALRLHGCLSGCPAVTSTTDFGANAGGGAYVPLTDLILVRAEVKYLWAPGKHPDLSRPDNYGFWRVTAGFTLSWTIAP